MYPLKFKSIYKEKIWGGRRLEAYRDDLPPNKNIGESWDLACHDYGDSVVENGEYAGKTISQLISEHRNELLGAKIDSEQFPLSVKIITADEKLSIQVHPSEDYVKKMNFLGGRTEAWYVIDADPGAYLYLGIRNCTREEFRKALDDDTYEKCINKVEVKAGDMFYVKSGLLHCIGGGITLLEVHENFEKEFRIFDYNRGRDLDLKEALDVLDFETEDIASDYRLITYKGNNIKEYNLPANFNIEVYNVQESMHQTSDRNRFHIFTCVKGEGEIVHLKGREKIATGDSYLIPAALGRYELEGEMTLVKSYVPI
ncbi:mannose-6-phosphate isomerase, type 1 [Dethiosulfatibacter aminovorans DSM 17477]|uniref:Phosphohexomutase n=1 Tax=Dethiosulfatibacter aminovorans DSM 17477 TaxID=1121476 RepID=A0A1M6EGL6_9FIRM|nr:type I phosphomannose isomerase catalytic subunit [Dethiosulfatibacter aminovorans]SHI84529.1 mannose-6-phosphate isomerase, type 1 [Dethiosulfatibacter aminovorans DSM 17477]